MLFQPLEQEAIVPEVVSRRSILIVDDDAAMADVLASALKGQGFNASIASLGKLGLTRARTEQPDLVVLDLCLPDADGFELCQELVDDDATCEIPVIIVSGLDRADILRRARSVGCRYFVRKPYDPNVLLTLIEQALDEAGRA